MISEQQQEQASLYVLGALTAGERTDFEAALRGNAELHALVLDLEKITAELATEVPEVGLPPGLKDKVLQRIDAAEKSRATPALTPSAAALAGLHFHSGDNSQGWKQLPIPGAWIKLLSLERERGYAVLMGKLEPGVRYPAHQNVGPEDFYILTGDLHIGDLKLNAGDFHHAEGGSMHPENHSVAGCTLLAVLTTDDPLVAFAMA
ncbi:MAG: cupin domain-containing protein [Akkermansiaceae bacterium]|nr:cupin domain-containing protein [Verrucomicrobiales bacterium]